jgi:hypothetical protein
MGTPIMPMRLPQRAHARPDLRAGKNDSGTEACASVPLLICEVEFTERCCRGTIVLVLPQLPPIWAHPG